MLQVTDELVDKPLAVNFTDHVSVIIIPQCSAQFLVVHVWFVLPGAPELSDNLRVV